MFFTQLYREPRRCASLQEDVMLNVMWEGSVAYRGQRGESRRSEESCLPIWSGCWPACRSPYQNIPSSRISLHSWISTTTRRTGSVLRVCEVQCVMISGWLQVQYGALYDGEQTYSYFFILSRCLFIPFEVCVWNKGKIRSRVTSVLKSFLLDVPLRSWKLKYFKQSYWYQLLSSRLLSKNL